MAGGARSPDLYFHPVVALFNHHPAAAFTPLFDAELLLAFRLHFIRKTLLLDSRQAVPAADMLNRGANARAHPRIIARFKFRAHNVSVHSFPPREFRRRPGSRGSNTGRLRTTELRAETGNTCSTSRTRSIVLPCRIARKPQARSWDLFSRPLWTSY